MTIEWEYSYVDNGNLLKKVCQEQVLKALETVGIQAEGDVKIAMTETWPETGTDIVDKRATAQRAEPRESQRGRGSLSCCAVFEYLFAPR